MRIKILIISSSYPRYYGDFSGNFIHEISKRLDKSKYCVLVLSPHCRKCKRKELLDNVQIYRFRYFIPVSQQSLAYNSGISSNIRKKNLAKIQVPFFFISELFSTLKLCRKNKIQIIHSHWLLPQGLTGAICKKALGIKHVTNIHGSDINTILNSEILTKITKFTLKYSDLIIANSSYTKEKLLQKFPEVRYKCSLVPMGIDLSKYNVDMSENTDSNGSVIRDKEKILENIYLEKERGPLILSVGRLVDWKGTEYLVRSVESLKKYFLGIKLVIIGEGPEKEKLERLVQDLKLSNNVIFKGYLDNEGVINHYRIADVFVLPSIDLNGQTEGLGVVLLEAMACNVPVIGSNVGGIPDIIRDGWNGFLVPEKDPKAIAEKIKIILEDDKLREEFTINGYITLKNNFSWDIIQRKNEEIYNKLMDL